MILMSSEDYLDAYAKIMKLGLKHKQVRSPLPCGAHLSPSSVRQPPRVSALCRLVQSRPQVRKQNKTTKQRLL